MKVVPVYRMDYRSKTRVPIGVIEERRISERGNNLLGLLRKARNMYALSAADAHEIVIGGVCDFDAPPFAPSGEPGNA